MRFFHCRSVFSLRFVFFTSVCPLVLKVSHFDDDSAGSRLLRAYFALGECYCPSFFYRYSRSPDTRMLGSSDANCNNNDLPCLVIFSCICTHKLTHTAYCSDAIVLMIENENRGLLCLRVVVVGGRRAIAVVQNEPIKRYQTKFNGTRL